MSTIHDPKSEALASSSDVGAHTPPLATDALSDVLRAVRLTGASFFVWDVSWPYATPVPSGDTFAPVLLPGAQQIISYHIVYEGTAWAAVLGQEPVELEAGDVLLVPHGDAYVIASSQSACTRAELDVARSLEFFRLMAAGELPFVVEDGGGGETSTRLVCGFLGCDLHPFNPVLIPLPSLVRLRRPERATQDPIDALLELALAESRRQRPGGHATLLGLSELLFVEVLRRCITEESTNGSGWLAALGDPIAGRALAHLHRDPSRPWTLDSLAREAGVSRSHLAETFTTAVGEPPMRYLARWRMQLATRLLVDGTAKIAAVAHAVGYGSEAAFSRAFKRALGVSPATWRSDKAVRALPGGAARDDSLRAPLRE